MNHRSEEKLVTEHEKVACVDDPILFNSQNEHRTWSIVASRIAFIAGASPSAG